jgi:hypothetical protein
MATPAVLAPHNVHTTLNYFKVEGNEAPYNYVESPPEGTPRTNIKEDTWPAVIHDVRGREDTVGLDKTGFKFVRHVSSEKEFVDEEAIKTRYYQEVEELLKKETGAKRVLIFDHTIRRNYDANTPMTRGPVVSRCESTRKLLADLYVRNAFTSTRHTPPASLECIIILEMMLTASSSLGSGLSTSGARSETLSPIIL